MLWFLLCAQGNRFAVLHGDGPKPSVSFYAMRDMKASTRGVVHLGTLEQKQVNALYWSPQGRFIVLAGLKVRACRGHISAFTHLP